MHIGFLDEFRNEPTVPILGDATEFLWLAGVIESRGIGSLSSLPEVRLENMLLALSYTEAHPPRFRGRRARRRPAASVRLLMA